jgi:signal transduction histidine kinase
MLPPRIRVALLLGVCALIVVEWALTKSAFESAVVGLDKVYVDSIPSLVEISGAASDLERLRREMRLVHFAQPSETVRRDARAQVADLLASLRDHAIAESKTPMFPHERELQPVLADSIDRVDDACRAMFAAETPEQVQALEQERFFPSIDAAHDTLVELTRINVRGGADSAQEVLHAHDRAARWSIIFGGSCLFLVLGVWAIGEVLIRRHERAVGERMSELDAFASRVAHDLRGVLSIVTVSTNLLRRREGAAEDAERVLERIDGAVRRSSTLMEGLLEFARSGARPEPGARSSVNKALEDVRATLRPLIESERVDLKIDVAGEVLVAAHSGVVTSILQNLLRNAIVYLGDSARREVSVSARRSADRVVLEVADTGPGIEPELRRRLFVPFERGSTHVAGHGLGLATVKRLIDAHGGRIELETIPGGGSRFRIELPAG